MDLGIIAITLAVIFMAYRLRLVALVQSTVGGAVKVVDIGIDTAVSVAEEQLVEWELESTEKHTRRLGKLASRIDSDTPRTSAKALRAKLKELEAGL